MRHSSWLVLAAALLMVVDQAGATPQSVWQVVGATYNSVAFVDRSSIQRGAFVHHVRTLRVSGQPRSDGWSTAAETILIDCGTRMIAHGGLIITKPNGKQRTYRPAGAKRTAPGRGIFAKLYQAVCHGGPATTVADPKEWTRQNFKPGQDL